MTTADGSYRILRVHEAIFNPGSHTTLFSEYQMRENGIVVDSVAKRHTKDYVTKEKGTQSVYLPDGSVIPLVVRGGLMTFAFSKPSEDHYKKGIPIIEVTNDAIWKPLKHQDDLPDSRLHEDPLLVNLKPHKDTFLYDGDDPEDLISARLAQRVSTAKTSSTSSTANGKHDLELYDPEYSPGNDMLVDEDNVKDPDGTIMDRTSIAENASQPEETFYDCIQDDPDYFHYHSDTYTCRVNRVVAARDDAAFFDARQKRPNRNKRCLADYHAYKVQFDYDSIYHTGDKAYSTFDIDRTLAELSYEDLLGFDTKEEEGNDFFCVCLESGSSFP